MRSLQARSTPADGWFPSSKALSQHGASSRSTTTVQWGPILSLSPQSCRGTGRIRAWGQPPPLSAALLNNTSETCNWEVISCQHVGWQGRGACLSAVMCGAENPRLLLVGHKATQCARGSTASKERVCSTEPGRVHRGPVPPQGKGKKNLVPCFVYKKHLLGALGACTL